MIAAGGSVNFIIAGLHNVQIRSAASTPTRAIFGRSYAAEPAMLAKQLAADEAIAVADTRLLTVPNQLGVDHNAHAIESILKCVAPELGWR